MEEKMLTNELNLPQPFVDAATSNHRYKPKRYSVTEVLNGTCEAVLKRRHGGEADEDVSDKVWAIFGTAVHKVLQESEPSEGQMQEKWLKVDVGDYELSGIFDLYDPATGTVTDWKVTSVWTVQFADFESWRLQTLLYCWMLRKNGHGEASRGEIVAILRDHSMRKARTEADYPNHPVFRIGWDFTGEDFMEAERLVSDWFDAVRFQEKLGDGELEPCSEAERWHKPDKWAVMKDGRKRAVRVLDDEASADAMAEELGKGHHVEHRAGEDTKCMSYCPVASFCPYGREVQPDGDAPESR